jgi:diguanylate cyclase (GGDEF)-like protein
MFSTKGGTYLLYRYLSPTFLLIHLGIRLIFSSPNVFADLFVYNLVALLAALTAFTAPGFNDSQAKFFIGAAITLWAIGSFISTWNAFYEIQLPNYLPDVFYGFFYPLLCFGIFRAMTFRNKVFSLELLDTLIIAFGTTSVLAGLLLRPAMLHFQGTPFAVFFAIVYPIGDVVIVGLTISLVLKQIDQRRSQVLLFGVALFAVSDLYFLWISNNRTYTFGALSDDGWLMALILISQSLLKNGGEIELSDRLTSFATTVSLLLSALILAIGALRPNYFPRFVLIPGFITIALAFIRMTLAVRDARQVNEERELARTDELTGLANRRKFLAELELLLRKEGTLLILDLDGFKEVNDRYGHDVGDQLLRLIAHRFTRALSNESLLARLGGDEFGVVVYGDSKVGREAALALKACLSYPFNLPVGEVNVGVSIGAATNSAEISSKEDLLRSADVAMYVAKRQKLGLVERGK